MLGGGLTGPEGLQMSGVLGQGQGSCGMSLGPHWGGAGLTGQVRQEPGIAVDLVEQNVAAELIGFRAPPKDHHGVPQKG